jgi:hypothetical protein
LLLLAILLAVLLLLFLTHPIIHETFAVPYNQATIIELNLKADAHVSVWLWTAAPRSMQNAGGRVIKFYVTDPNQSDLGGYPLGVAGTGYFTPFTFVAQQDGPYDMHFENSIGDADSRTVSLYYRVALSIFGIPVEYILICISAAVIVLAITFGIILLTSRSRSHDARAPNPQKLKTTTQTNAEKNGKTNDARA